jgi:hypothetical protein
MSLHPAFELLDRVTGLVSAPVADVAAALASEPGVRVRAGGAGVELVDIELGAAGPTRAELEAALGPARELPRIPLTGFALLTFDGHAPLALFAHVDDATGRASRLMVRREGA